MIRYIYAIRIDRRARGAKAFERREVPADLVAASNALTVAAEARAKTAPAPTYQTSFDDLTVEDVASVFAAHRRKEVTLSGGRFTREPTIWRLLKKI